MLVHEDARAVVAGDDARRRVQARELVEGSERTVVFAVEAVERALDEVDRRLVRGLLREACDFGARLTLLAAREVYEDHQDARLDDVGVEFERAREGVLREFIVLDAAQALQNFVGEARAESAVRERERGVEPYGEIGRAHV